MALACTDHRDTRLAVLEYIDGLEELMDVAALEKLLAELPIPQAARAREQAVERARTAVSALPSMPPDPMLLIELDERQLLTFTGIPTVEDRLGDGCRELVLRDFVQLTFDWEEYGSDEKTHVWRFTEGEVMFAPPLGSAHAPWVHDEFG
jgi:hypothetical protein